MKAREAAGNVSMDTIEGDGSHSQTPYHEVFCRITKVSCGIGLIILMTLLLLSCQMLVSYFTFICNFHLHGYHWPNKFEDFPQLSTWTSQSTVKIKREKNLMSVQLLFSRFWVLIHFANRGGSYVNLILYFEKKVWHDFFWYGSIFMFYRNAQWWKTLFCYCVQILPVITCHIFCFQVLNFYHFLPRMSIHLQLLWTIPGVILPIILR